MIIRGIADSSLSRYCIRGFARLTDLISLSRPDDKFQRNLIETQRERIQKFYASGPNLFFPEVILSFTFSNPKNIADGSHIARLQRGMGCTDSKHNIRFVVRNISHSAGMDTRNISQTRIIAMNFNGNYEVNKPFLRIDGNHRLSVEESDLRGTSSMDMPISYCIVLLEETDNEAERFKQTAFYNINSKSIPLTPEEINRVILDNEDTFPEYYLTTNENEEEWGRVFVLARKLKKAITQQSFPSLKNALLDVRGTEQIRTILIDTLRLLKKHNPHDFNTLDEERIVRAFNTIAAIYTQTPQLEKSKSFGLLTAMVYFIITRNEKQIHTFKTWITDNLIHQLETVRADDLIAIYEKILEAKNKRIFVSMQFSDDTKVHYNFIKDVVAEINDEEGQEIKLEPLRIDHFNNGTSYKISDEILSQITNSGYVIADLTHSNKNVYHEVGFLMGLHKLREEGKINLLLICNTTKTQVPTEIGFNLRDYKIVTFNDTHELREPLKTNIIEFYK